MIREGEEEHVAGDVAAGLQVVAAQPAEGTVGVGDLDDERGAVADLHGTLQREAHDLLG